MSVKDELEQHMQVLENTIEQYTGAMMDIAVEISTCFERGNKLLLVGNGGSAADAQHMAAEFVNKFSESRAALPAIALTTDSSVLTSIGNDEHFSFIFARQIEALAKRRDILMAISTSGSVNVLKALEVANARGLRTIGLTGLNGRAHMSERCDICIVVPSTNTARVQECHEFILHVICGRVEYILFGGD